MVDDLISMRGWVTVSSKIKPTPPVTSQNTLLRIATPQLYR